MMLCGVTSIRIHFQFLGSSRCASVLECVDMPVGSLRHSSLQGMPPSVAMTPDIEQKLNRMRNISQSPDSIGAVNKVYISFST